VQAEVEGEALDHGEPEEPVVKVAVGKCPSCKSVLVGLLELIDYAEQGSPWSDADRLWPQPKRAISTSVPSIVKGSLEEADRCFSAGAFTACAVMCGRAIEGICVHHKTKSKTLNPGLKELLDREIIDQRLFTWGEELRKLRNLGAHANDEKVLYRDAHDVLAFAHAMSEYVFVLSEQFQQFMARRNKAKEEKD
jgi:hypothetical protein